MDIHKTNKMRLYWSHYFCHVYNVHSLALLEQIFWIVYSLEVRFHLCHRYNLRYCYSPVRKNGNYHHHIKRWKKMLHSLESAHISRYNEAHHPHEYMLQSHHTSNKMVSAPEFGNRNNTHEWWCWSSFLILVVGVERHFLKTVFGCCMNLCI